MYTFFLHWWLPFHFKLGSSIRGLGVWVIFCNIFHFWGDRKQWFASGLLVQTPALFIWGVVFLCNTLHPPYLLIVVRVVCHRTSWDLLEPLFQFRVQSLEWFDGHWHNSGKDLYNYSIFSFIPWYCFSFSCFHFWWYLGLLYHQYHILFFL